MMMVMNYVVWLTDERRLALFPAGVIVRELRHREYPTRREQDLNSSDNHYTTTPLNSAPPFNQMVKNIVFALYTL